MPRTCYNVGSNAHTDHCVRTAEYFTAVRGRGTTRTREQFDTLEQALVYASSFADGRTMLYAVTGTGSCVHVRNA